MTDHDPRPAPAVDVHQHLWSEALVEALRERVDAPRVVGTTLLLDGEPPSELVVESPKARRDQNDADGIDLALLAFSSPLGVEHLPPDEAADLFGVWHVGAVDLAEDDLSGLGAWASTGLVEPDLDGLGAALDAGCVGVQVPADAMATPNALEQLAPVLAVAEGRDKPAFVHPGRARAATGGLPSWWVPLVDYPAQMAASWWSWHHLGRSLLPSLRVCFGAGAGLAPLHHERLAARGGRMGAIDPGVFVETSSYGPRAVDALARVLGIDALVLGSDRPYADPRDPGLGDAAWHALTRTNPRRLLDPAQPPAPEDRRSAA
ncbi:amidohydrolase family protein [Solicola sp. PLA-1-18]|uniref:amidohydrolase family protein n=1 Tax=Solicola sp. PLA-1-18 TaxID=3380532 RepID=UPI003B7F1C52